MGAYPRDTGSNPVEGNGHFFPSYRQLYLSSFSDTHTARLSVAVILKCSTILAVIRSIQQSASFSLLLLSDLLSSLYWPWDPLSIVTHTQHTQTANRWNME